ncbi:MAG: phenylacetic acid degradation operon negative regulatory protein [Microgenomates group bacterium Gr01-1014_5]|nr:MAG: phenylacetic acid degradation operon negative regulatory protein [Microgenomates group bacterium Gr01-1014_5]
MLRKIKKKYPKAKQILAIAAVGAFIAGSLMAPGLSRLFKKTLSYDDIASLLGEEEWEEFDERRLRERLKELRKKKYIKIWNDGEKFVLQITQRGRRKLFQHNLADLTIPTPEKWDGRWRIITYDIPKGKDAAREAIRTTLKRLNFHQLQKSVYLYPYPCEEVVMFLRELYDIGENVKILTVGQLEDEEAYKEYFNM